MDTETKHATDASPTKQRRVMTTSAISVNAIASIFLVLAMVYLFVQIVYHQQEMKTFQEKLQIIQGKTAKTYQSTRSLESAHAVGTGNRVRSAPAPGDVYKITSWKLQHTSGNMTYDNNGHLTVNIPGVYVVYSQMFYFDRNNTYTGYNVYIDQKRILKTIYSIVDKYKPFHTQYVSGVFKITKGQRIWVGTSLTRQFFFNEVSSFFGAYMLHP